RAGPRACSRARSPPRWRSHPCRARARSTGRRPRAPRRRVPTELWPPSSPWALASWDALLRRGSTTRGLARARGAEARAGGGGGVRLGERLVDERRDVEQEHGAVGPELGSPRDTGHRAQRRAERLDDDVLLADQLVDHEAHAVLGQAHDDDVDA